MGELSRPVPSSQSGASHLAAAVETEIPCITGVIEPVTPRKDDGDAGIDGVSTLGF